MTASVGRYLGFHNTEILTMLYHSLTAALLVICNFFADLNPIRWTGMSSVHCVRLCATLVALNLACSTPVFAAEPWWDSDWNERIQLVFDNSSQKSNLFDFPILVRLDSNRIDFTKTMNSGQDIRFVDNDENELDYEIERWNENGVCSIWVLVDKISAASNSDYIWMYYSNPEAEDELNPEDVWKAKFELVWHCSEAAGKLIADSTGQDNDGTKLSSKQPLPNATGRFGGSQRYDGSNDGVKVNGMVPEKEITIEAWIRPDSIPGASGRATIARFGNDEPFFGLTENADGKAVLNFTRNGEQLNGVAVIPFGRWSHVAVTHSLKNFKAHLYVNGVLDNSGLIFNSDKGKGFVVGVSGFGATDSPFDGEIDEVRVSKVFRSSDWVFAQHQTMTDSFVNWPETAKEIKVVTWKEIPPINSN